jgi:hypothetical protein
MALYTFENTSASDFIPSRLDASWSPGTELYTLKAAILEVVENQFSNSVPPETRQTLEELLAARYSG